MPEKETLDAMTIRRLPTRGAMGVLGLLLIGSAGSQAQNDPRFSASLGGFFTDRNSETRLDGSSGEGTDVDLEGDLGLEQSSTVFRFDGYWRFAERHRVDFSVFDLSRSASKRIERDISWQGTDFEVDTRITSDIDLEIYKASYSWIFLKRERGFLAATAGLYVADINTSLAAEELGIREGNGITAPLPVIGLRGAHDLGRRWTLRGSAEVFAVEYNGIDGSLYDAFAGLDFRLTDHVALGAGFNAVELDVNVGRSRFDGSFDWSYSGALLYVKLDW
jgi:hypothetical protein